MAFEYVYKHLFVHTSTFVTHAHYLYLFLNVAHKLIMHRLVITYAL